MEECWVLKREVISILFATVGAILQDIDLNTKSLPG